MNNLLLHSSRLQFEHIICMYVYVCMLCVLYVYLLVAHIRPYTLNEYTHSHLCLSLSLERARINVPHTCTTYICITSYDIWFECQSIRLVCFSMRGYMFNSVYGMVYNSVCVYFSVCVSRWRPSFYFLLVPQN